jgi:hypothetical protein
VDILYAAHRPAARLSVGTESAVGDSWVSWMPSRPVIRASSRAVRSFRRAFLAGLAARTGRDFTPAPGVSFGAVCGRRYDVLAAMTGQHLDTAAVLALAGGGARGVPAPRAGQPCWPASRRYRLPGRSLVSGTASSAVSRMWRGCRPACGSGGMAAVTGRGRAAPGPGAVSPRSCRSSG